MEAGGVLAPTALHVLAGAQVKRNASPTPVVDLQLAGEEGLGIGVRSHVGLLAIRPHRRVQDRAGIILAAHGILERPPGLEWTYGLDNLRLLGPDRVGVERGRRLHG